MNTRQKLTGDHTKEAWVYLCQIGGEIRRGVLFRANGTPNSLNLRRMLSSIAFGLDFFRFSCKLLPKLFSDRES